MGFRFLHSSDWQLGMRRHFLDDDAQARFTQARIDVIRTLARVVREREAAFVVVAGDVFEHNQVGDRTVDRALGALAEIPVPVFLLPGNHDPLEPGCLYRRPAFAAACPPHVVVLDDALPRSVPGCPTAEVVGAPWLGKHPREDLVAAALAGLPAPAAGVRRIVVGHGAVDVLQPDREAEATIALAPLEAALAAGTVHYVALGDRHSATAVDARGAVRYCGAPEPTDFDEQRPGRVLVVDPCSAVPQVDEVTVGTWRFVDHRAELEQPGDVDALLAELTGLPDKERTIVRLALVGSLRIDDLARLDTELDRLAGAFASLRRWARHDDLRPRPDALDERVLALSGYAKTAWDELCAAARDEADGPDAIAARDALVLLHRFAARGGDA
ncbi:MAG: metallophosphoesterase [Planctomycetes bacterium]|nr:metallophosphoesterase [Planctomycetota bacterium]